MKRSNHDKFIFLRFGIWTFKKRVPGRKSPLQISLETSDRTLAREKRDQILKDLANEELEKIRGPRMKRATIGQVLAIYEQQIASTTRIEPRTVVKCVNDARVYLRYARVTSGDETLMTTFIDAATVRSFKANYLADAGTDREALEVRRRGAEAKLRNIRAIFSRHALPLYKHLHLPPMAEFLADARVQTETRKHATIAPATLRDMGEAIAQESADLQLVHMLHKFAGLRNDEICNLRLEWFSRAPWGQLFIGVLRRPYFEPKQSEGFVPIHSGVAALLARHVAGLQAQDFVLLPNGSVTAREELVNRTHSIFMRRFLPAKQYAKAGYELRRWAAQMFELKHGKDAAENFLRHKRDGVAAAHYLDEWARWRRLGDDLGITPDEARGANNVELLGTWKQGADAFADAHADAINMAC